MMTDIPRAVVSARRTAGVILLGAGLITVVALTLLIGWWATRPPTAVATPNASNTVTSPAATYQPSPTYAQPVVVDASAALQQHVAADRAAIANIPDGYWVPQLSSKRLGLLPDGVTYTTESILADHQQLRGAYSGVALLWSGDYPTFDSDSFWVTVVASQYSNSSADALAWCDSQGLDRHHCYAKRISATTRYPTNTDR